MHYKLGIYGEPATGKSVFALSFPKPYFITTDSNYEFLYDFGAKEENHTQVTTWAEFKKLVKEFDFSPYETIVVDVVEDLYLWAENEYCTKNRIEDLSDIGYGKGYKIVRSDFAIELFKLLAKNANVILLAHSVETQGKTQRGGDFTAYAPSSIIPEKVWSMINGRLRYFFRTHLEDVSEGDKIVTKRMLSISPKPHEMQINRGLNVDNLPSDIELDFKTFSDTLGLDFGNTNKSKPAPKVETPKVESTPKVEDVKKAIAKAKTPKVETTPKVEEPKKEVTVEEAFDMSGIELETPQEAPKPKVEEPKTETPKVETAAEKLARIRAMLEKQKNNK